ncbi:MAG: hypothetical protein WCG84_00115 [Candidatus Moraniibacteriota bacterium]
MNQEFTMASLQQVLDYDNARVLNKFRTMYSVSQDEVQEIFTEMKKWLWLSAQRKASVRNGQLKDFGTLVIHTGMVIIDELWHTFILHTQDYTDFCNRYFGFYIHHSPGSPDFLPQSDEKNREQLNYIWDLLGGETLVRWYEEYPVRYSPEILLGLIRQPVFGRPCEVVV